VIKYFKDNPNAQYKTFEVRSDNSKSAGTILKQGDEVRIYRDDVFKSISNGNDGFGQTINAINNTVIFP
jgi:hypothetical protein